MNNLPDGFVLDNPAPTASSADLPDGFELDKPIAAQSPITASGLYKAADAGVARSIAGLAGLPKTLASLGDTLEQKGLNAASSFLSMPQPPQRDTSQPGIGSFKLPSSEDVMAHIQKQYYGGAAPYEPQNRAERIAANIGEFAPNAAIPGGLVRRAASVALPAVATEAAQEAGAGPVGQTIAGLTGAYGASKLGNLAERLAAPAIAKVTTGELKDLTTAGYGDVTKQAVAAPLSKSDAATLADKITSDLHAQNMRPNNAPGVYEQIEKIRDAGTG